MLIELLANHLICETTTSIVGPKARLTYACWRQGKQKYFTESTQQDGNHVEKLSKFELWNFNHIVVIKCNTTTRRCQQLTQHYFLLCFASQAHKLHCTLPIAADCHTKARQLFMSMIQPCSRYHLCPDCIYENLQMSKKIKEFGLPFCKKWCSPETFWLLDPRTVLSETVDPQRAHLDSYSNGQQLLSFSNPCLYFPLFTMGFMDQ